MMIMPMASSTMASSSRKFTAAWPVPKIRRANIQAKDMSVAVGTPQPLTSRATEQGSVATAPDSWSLTSKTHCFSSSLHFAPMSSCPNLTCLRTSYWRATLSM